jgi:SAM-dependent methyltransferase
MFHPKGPTFLELAHQALSSTERGYDLLAPKFDYTPFRTPEVILDAVADHLRADAPFGAGFDLCCGTGAAMRMLRPLCRERVVGIDFSQGMLEVARQRTSDAPGTAPLEFVRGNVLSMPFDRTKPGGRFVFATVYLASLGGWAQPSDVAEVKSWALCRHFRGPLNVSARSIHTATPHERNAPTKLPTINPIKEESNRANPCSQCASVNRQPTVVPVTAEKIKTQQPAPSAVRLV